MPNPNPARYQDAGGVQTGYGGARERSVVVGLAW
jgi:hypothetical protein